MSRRNEGNFTVKILVAFFGLVASVMVLLHCYNLTQVSRATNSAILGECIPKEILKFNTKEEILIYAKDELQEIVSRIREKKSLTVEQDKILTKRSDLISALDNGKDIHISVKVCGGE